MVEVVLLLLLMLIIIIIIIIIIQLSSLLTCRVNRQMVHKRNHTTYKHKSQKTMNEMHERNTDNTNERIRKYYIRTHMI